MDRARVDGLCGPDPPEPFMNPEQASLRQDDQFREIVGVLRRRKWILLGTTVLFAAFGVVSSQLQAAAYSASSRILIQDYFQGPSSPASDPVSRVSQVGEAPDIASQIGLMESPETIQNAFAQANVPYVRGYAESGVVSITQENTTPVLDISVNLPDGDAAVRVAQAMPVAYDDYLARTLQTRSAQATQIARARVLTTRADLDKAQRALDAELSNQGPEGLVAVGGNEGSTRSVRVNTYEGNLESAKIALASAQTTYDEDVAKLSSVPKMIPDTTLRSSADRVIAAEGQIAEMEGQLRALRTQYTDRSPDIISLQARIQKAKDVKNSLPKNTDTTSQIRNPERTGFEARIRDERIHLAASHEEVAKMQALLDKERKALNSYESRLPKQRTLENNVAQKQAVYGSAAGVLSQLESVISQGRQPVRTLSVSDPVKTAPVVGRTIAVFTFMGFVLSMLLALIRDRLDNRIYTLEQIYDVSGAVPIGQVPSSTRALGPNAGAQSRSRVLESYRSLRFNLESAAAAGAAQSVLVASASAGEGRAGLSINLATEAATDARRTILVDADMRTPELHDMMKLRRTPGLAEVLSGSVSLDEALVPTSQPNLMFLPAGGDTTNPLELLAGSSFAAIHEALKERADVIVLNSPSLMRYTDARAIAKVADSVLFVAKRGFTRRDAMRYCIGMLRRAHARILGVVLSDDAGRTTDVPYFAVE